MKKLMYSIVLECIYNDLAYSYDGSMSDSLFNTLEEYGLNPDKSEHGDHGYMYCVNDSGFPSKLAKAWAERMGGGGSEEIAQWGFERWERSHCSFAWWATLRTVTASGCLTAEQCQELLIREIGISFMDENTMGTPGGPLPIGHVPDVDCQVENQSEIWSIWITPYMEEKGDALPLSKSSWSRAIRYIEEAI